MSLPTGGISLADTDGALALGSSEGVVLLAVGSLEASGVEGVEPEGEDDIALDVGVSDVGTGVVGLPSVGMGVEGVVVPLEGPLGSTGVELVAIESLGMAPLALGVSGSVVLWLPSLVHAAAQRMAKIGVVLNIVP